MVFLFSMFMAYSGFANLIHTASEPLAGDNFLKFVEELTSITNIQMMEAQGLTMGRSKLEPWSGSYWPIHKGIIGARYVNKKFPRSSSFETNYERFLSESAESIVASGRLNELSPSEKYDLLIGDPEWSLTKLMWKKGRDQFERDGFVAGWTGICHGWAAASHLLPESPYYPVTLNDVTDKYAITFHANDIKGLISWVWASAPPTSYRAGDRCRQSVVKVDPTLRPLEASCLDSNPMTWHLAIINKVGLQQKSLVMDSSRGTEVWNYPITSYSYHYFDPKTFIPTESLNKAIRGKSEMPLDRYSIFRSPRTFFIVGIIMEITHPALTIPTVGITSRNTTKKMTFIYDLELDENRNIVGGEWFSKANPDFIWSYPASSRAVSFEESNLSPELAAWSVDQSTLPVSLAELAKESSRRGRVLNIISSALLTASSKKGEPLPEEIVAEEEEIEED